MKYPHRHLITPVISLALWACIYMLLGPAITTGVVVTVAGVLGALVAYGAVQDIIARWADSSVDEINNYRLG